LSDKSATFYDKRHQWRFPSGATVTFGFLELERHKYRYQGSTYQYIAFDELTQFTESQYTYLLSRLSKRTGVDIPLRMRATTNPGGYGHEWVRRRFIEEGVASKRPYIPARLEDNPFVDQESHEEMLKGLSAIEYAQLRLGDWDVVEGGTKFNSAWFEGKTIHNVPNDLEAVVRYWDLAATEPSKGRDPDWTVGAKVGYKNGEYFVIDIARARASAHNVEKLIRDVAISDGKAVQVFMEQEPGASGKSLCDHYAREVLPGFAFKAHRSTGSKDVRANPVASALEGGRMWFLNGPWLRAMIDEMTMFPYGQHDDQVDALSGSVDVLSSMCRKIKVYGL
jgi:predicted phage terminase large subunit-like protein